jgi:transcription elongation factor Elf1
MAGRKYLTAPKDPVLPSLFRCPACGQMKADKPGTTCEECRAEIEKDWPS